MAEFGKGAPVGKSFEVYAPDDRQAAEAAYTAADKSGFRAGRVLLTEQIEAGKWEVVLEERPSTAAELTDEIDAWFEQARANPDPENRHLGAVALLGKARALLTAPREPAEIAADIQAAAVVLLAKTITEQGSVRLRYADFMAMDSYEERGVGIFMDVEPGGVLVFRHVTPVPAGEAN